VFIIHSKNRNTVKGNTEALLVASKGVAIEINAEKSKYISKPC
jgi:hypothetical protein